MAKTNGNKTVKKAAVKKATPKKVIVKRTAEELAAMRTEKLAKLEVDEAARAAKIAARKAKLETQLTGWESKAQAKAAKLAEKNEKKATRELTRLEKKEARATRVLQIEADRQAKVAAKALSGTGGKRGAGFKSGPEGKDSIGDFITRTVKDTPMTLVALQDALIAYYGPSEKAEQWKRTVATYFKSLANQYPAKLKLAKKGLFAVYNKEDDTLMVRTITPKEGAQIFAGLTSYKTSKMEARAKKIAEAQAIVERINAIRGETTTAIPEAQ